ncbi:hypothetical protein [Wolbachia endosymbiont (group A) of Myopa testacea]
MFGSNEEKIDESTSQTDASVSLPKLDSLDKENNDINNYDVMNNE